MGFFSSISKAIQDGKEKARLETIKATERVEYLNLSDACRIIADELKHASSIPKQVSWSKTFQAKLNKTTSNEELYAAFCDMYDLGKRSDGRFEMNMAQRIGKKLYNENDYRVEANSEETLFRPKKY